MKQTLFKMHVSPFTSWEDGINMSEFTLEVPLLSAVIPLSSNYGILGLALGGYLDGKALLFFGWYLELKFGWFTTDIYHYPPGYL